LQFGFNKYLLYNNCVAVAFAVARKRRDPFYPEKGRYGHTRMANGNVPAKGGKPSYNITRAACYAGYFVQAVNINLLAVIFIPLREQYGLTYAQFGTLVFTNFITQLLISVAFSKSLDRFGTRPHLIPSLCVCICGLVMFTLTPDIFPANIFIGLLLSMFLVAGGGGLVELCLSPIIDAIPSEAADSSKALSFLHSFYAWGQADIQPAEITEIRQALLDYCRLDTLAMTRILEKLYEACGLVLATV